MQTYTRKKLEILIEAPLLKRAEEVLGELGVAVFTVFDGREGRGLHAGGRAAGVMELEQRLIIAITSPETAEKAFLRFGELFQRYPGVIFASDVEVLRAERF